MDKKEAIEIIKEAVKGNARKEDFFKTPNEIIGDVLDEYAEAINKNSVIPDVVHQREQFKSMVFDMANKLAIVGNGDEAVMMHEIHNRL